MGFASPAWLLMLVPWAGLVVLALRAYRPRVYVPFLDLWPREAVAPEQRRGWRPPPLPLILLLIALLLGVLALGRPQVTSARPTLRTCTIVVDRGVTMLAGDRLAKSAATAIEALMPLLPPDAEVRVIDHSGARVIGPSQLSGAALGEPVALSVHSALRARIAELIERDDGPLLVLSDLAELPEHARVIPVRPIGPVNNVGIVAASMDQRGCLLTLRNDSEATSATLTFGGNRHQVALPARGQQGTTLVPGASGKLTLLLNDDLPDDNSRWPTAEAIPARLELDGDVPEVIRRFAQVYEKSRPATPISPRVIITTSATAAPRSIMVPASGVAARVDPPMLWPHHPLLSDWRASERPLLGNLPLPPGEWTVLLQHRESVLIAAGERRAFIGYLPGSEEEIVDYLVLLTNAVEHCVGGVVSATSPTRLPAEWQRIEPQFPEPAPGLRAGLFARGDERVAVHVEAPELREFDSSANAQIAGRLRALAEAHSRLSLAPWLLVVAAVLLVASVIAVRR